MNRLSSACEAKFAEALACVETTGERFWEAEIYRLRGELFQTDGDEDTTAKPSFSKVEADHKRAVAPLLREDSLCSPHRACHRRCVLKIRYAYEGLSGRRKITL